jgi:formamidopyrimidine-DNA glycosylase
VPELAEVEHARGTAHRLAVGRTVVDVDVADDPIVVLDGPERVAAALRGARIAGTGRRGKHLWLVLEGRPAVLLHLGMTGALRTRGDQPIQLEASPAEPDRSWPPRFTKLRIRLDDGGELAFTNARRLGRIRLRDDPAGSPPISDLGFDPLLDLPAPAAFGAALARRRGVIKAVLLDQGFAAGVGNWIADEVLYQAGIDPRRRASDLELPEAEALRRALGDVVGAAVAADARKDRFPAGWLFHRRWGRKADQRTLDGHAIEHLTIGGRTTAWVPAVQR